MTDASISVSYPKKFPAVVDFCLPCIKSRVELVVASNLQYTPGGKRVTARSQPRITIEPAQLCSLEWLVDLACRFENFFSLCLGTSVRLRAVFLETPTGDNGWLIAHRKGGKAEKPDLQAWVRCDCSRLGGAIAAWFATPEVFRPLENLVYGAIRGSSLVAETEFLSLAQAIESFHRLTDTTTTIPPDLFKELFKSLSRTIAEQHKDSANSAIVTRMLDAIRYCNEPSFRHRIELLLSQVSPTTAQKLLGAPAVFEQTLRQTRNYFTHPGIKKQSRVLTGAAELFCLIRSSTPSYDCSCFCVSGSQKTILLSRCSINRADGQSCKVPSARCSRASPVAVDVSTTRLARWLSRGVMVPVRTGVGA